MKNGHYTAKDIETLEVKEATKTDCKTAWAVINESPLKKVTLLCHGGMAEWHVRTEERINGKLAVRQETWEIIGHGKGIYDVDTVPERYRVVAELVRKKSGTHGGKRFAAGRKKTVSEADRKKPRSFSLSDAEYEKVRKFVEELRGNRAS